MPTLEDLRNHAAPAWLWDWQAGRVVWANGAGLAWFGCETLFDLVDRPFDPAEPGVERIIELGNGLRRGQAREIVLHFPSTGRAEPLVAQAHVHSLSDGRPGLLLVARREGDRNGKIPGETAALAFEALPVAALVVSRDGSVRFANAAAHRLLGEHASQLARSLISRAETAGTVSEVRRGETVLGQRDLRITVRLLPSNGGGHAIVLAEDITERRALERQIARDQRPSDQPTDHGLSPREAEAFVTLGQTLRSEVTLPRRPRRAVDLPETVRKMLDAQKDAAIFEQNGVLAYGNPAAVALLGFASPEELLGDSSLATAVREIGPDLREAVLPTAGGISIRVKLESSTIPWRGGPARRLALHRIESTEPAPPQPVAQSDLTSEIEDGAESSTAATADLPEPDQPEILAPGPVVADAELRAILDTATDGIITLDGEGRIKTFSAGAEAIFGYRSAEVSQRPFADLMTPESRKTVREYLAALQGPGLASVFNDGREVSAIVKQGGEVPLFLTIGKLQQAGPDRAALCAVVRDITQWKKTEAELREAKEEAERSSRLKSEFLANVSHELRTPLNAIIGFSEMMRMQSFGEIANEKYRSYINDIHSSGSHLLSLINDLLDLSKVEAGRLELNFTSVNLAEIIDQSFKLIQETATQARVILRKSIPADLPNVVADLRSMRQIMLNILSNAIKFTDPGGQVIVSAAMTDAGELKLRIKDTGVGMSDDALRQALEPFRRVPTEGREAPGTGLGLPLTKALAEANRAQFAISSAPGMGTTIEITFPTTRVLAA